MFGRSWGCRIHVATVSTVSIARATDRISAVEGQGGIPRVHSATAAKIALVTLTDHLRYVELVLGPTVTAEQRNATWM